MTSTGIIFVALAGALLAGPAAAQSAGTVELGVFGRWTDFGAPITTDVLNRLPSENGIGGGLRLGWFIARRLEIEADASSTSVDAAGGGTASYLPIHAGLTYNFRLGHHAAFLLGGRYVHNSYGNAADFSDDGVGALAGVRFGIVRLETTMDWMSSDNLAHSSYHNLGIDAGLSLLLGRRCNKSADGVTVSPARAVLERGGTASFTAVATHCGKAGEVTWTATGGNITTTGGYTAGATPGSYQVTATALVGGLSGTAQVVINAPPPPAPPPPPPPITLAHIHLRPQHARVKVNELVPFTVTGTMSDSSSRMLSDCALGATGNATQSGNSFSWDQYGAYTVTANCEGMSDQATVEVPLEVVVYGTNFAFNKDKLTPMGMDSVHAAADSLKNHPAIKVRVAGFADFVGSDKYNCNLSWLRARTVHRALNLFGIADDRIISVEGFGHAYPVPDDQVPQEWKDRNKKAHDKGKWWDRKVVITSATKDAGMMACREPPAARKARP